VLPGSGNKSFLQISLPEMRLQGIGSHKTNRPFLAQQFRGHGERMHIPPAEAGGKMAVQYEENFIHVRSIVPPLLTRFGGSFLRACIDFRAARCHLAIF
jgi:hypothetical protein